MPIFEFDEVEDGRDCRGQRSSTTTGDIIRFAFLRPIPVMRLQSWNLTEKVMSFVTSGSGITQKWNRGYS